MTRARRSSVMIVEDERIVALDLQQTLHDFGYEASAIASSPDEALALASERRPDLVLMDIRIKGPKDGIETAQLLGERFRIPVVYLTAHADEGTLARARLTEPHGYLVKPIKAAELRSTIEIALYRHALAQELREREKWFSTTLRSIADAVLTVDVAGRVTFMNAVAERLMGTSASAAIGQPVQSVFRLLPRADGDADEPPSDPLETALRQRKPVNEDDLRLLNPETGVVRTISNASAPVLDGERCLGAVMVFRDTSDRKRLEAELETADRLASLGTMAAGVAHEVNNPLAVIVSNAAFIAEQLAKGGHELAGAGALAPDAALRLQEIGESLTDLQSAAHRIDRIVADLRDFARADRRAGQRASVPRAVEWASKTTSHELKHRARLILDLKPMPEVEGDELKLGQVLVNLLLNAAQAIEPGHAAQNEVRLSTRVAERERVVIEVHDSGPGIPAAIKSRIFEPFFTTKPVGLGTGLGLGICRGIVLSMGGELDVESEPGRGTTFRVTLNPASTMVAEPAPGSPPANLGRRARILAVDDEEMVLRVLKRVLHQHDVVCVPSAVQALELLEAGQTFDAIISDVMMPGMTGMEFYQALGARFPDLLSRLVFMSGGALTARTADFLQGTANPQVDKPFASDALLRALKLVL